MLYNILQTMLEVRLQSTEALWDCCFNTAAAAITYACRFPIGEVLHAHWVSSLTKVQALASFAPFVPGVVSGGCFFGGAGGGGVAELNMGFGVQKLKHSTF